MAWYDTKLAHVSILLSAEWNAMVSYVLGHKSEHATGGDDELTPADIGAEPALPADSEGYLHNNGAGVLGWTTPEGGEGSEPIMLGIEIWNDNIDYLVKGTPINFSALIETENSIVSYDWDFGDGSSHSSERSPTHIYTTPDDYEIVLIVTDSEDNTKTARYTLEIHAQPDFYIPGIVTYHATLTYGNCVAIINHGNYPDLPIGVENNVEFSSQSATFNDSGAPSDLPISDDVLSLGALAVTIVNS